MTSDKLTSQELFEANMALLLRDDLMCYVHRAFLELHGGATFYAEKYVRAICYQLMRIERGDCQRLLIIVPPRHLKSFCATVAFASWYLGRNPSKIVVSASYSADLSQGFGLQTRKLMSTTWHRAAFDNQTLDPHKTSAEEFWIAKGGGRRVSTSVGGTFTGKGADLIIIDDPIKAGNVYSETILEKCFTWITETVMSRFNEPKTGAMIVVAQRLHVNDIPGRLIEAGGWEVLEMPASAPVAKLFPIADDIDWSREAGELLCEERMDVETLDRMRSELGDLAFETQYQQRPAMPGGNLIKPEWFGTYEGEPKRSGYEGVMQSWDTASVPGDSNDYSVCTTWGFTGKYIDLLDVHRGRYGMPELVVTAKQLQQKWKPDLIVIEASHSGHALIQSLNSAGVKGVRPLTPRHSKEERMAARTPVLASGAVRLPTQAPWCESFLAECAVFPNGKHDDQVDTLSQMLITVAKRSAELRFLSRYR